MKTKEVLMKFLLVLCVAILTLNINAEDKKPLTVIPTVQTAKFAQKWWMPRHREKLAAKEKMAQVDLVFLGDSITHAWDTKAKNLWKKYYGSKKALNLGFSGDRTEHVLWRLNNGAVDGISPKALVLMIGTNNTGQKIRQDKAEDTALGIKAILDTLKQKLPETKILLLAIFPRDAKPDGKFRQVNETINARIKTYADEESVYFLNINNIFLDKNGILTKKVAKDLLHPNPAMYNNWAKAIEPKLKELMAR